MHIRDIFLIFVPPQRVELPGLNPMPPETTTSKPMTHYAWASWGDINAFFGMQSVRHHTFAAQPGGNRAAALGSRANAARRGHPLPVAIPLGRSLRLGCIADDCALAHSRPSRPVSKIPNPG